MIDIDEALLRVRDAKSVAIQRAIFTANQDAYVYISCVDRDTLLAHIAALRAQLEAARRDAERLSALVCNDFTDEQLAHGLAHLRTIRANLGAHASDETICGAIYDGMIYPIRKSLGWANTDPPRPSTPP